MTKLRESKQEIYQVAVIGAGFAGIGAGIQLKLNGYNSFVIFERSNEVGGTWRDNTYPGCACDIPSFLYSYSFEPNPEWRDTFSKQAQILTYIKHCVQKYEIATHIHFNTEIKHLKFNEAEGIWTVTTQSGENIQARSIISGTGPLNEPLYPKIKGLHNFKGEAFHSMHWNHNYDLKGKRVAVIGTGASAIQFVPEIAAEVAQLHLFQRTPPWIAPKNDKKISKKAQLGFKKRPLSQLFWREVIYWFLEGQGRAMFSKNWIRKWRTGRSLKHLHNSIPKGALRDKLTPNYELGCKRVLISDNYYPTLLRENVDLVTDPIIEILPNGLKTKSGQEYEVDAIIYGTGFQTTQFSHLFPIIGRNNRNLIEEFNEKGGEAFYGVAVSGFPNFHFLVGPNSGLGHNSIIHMMESQLNYILDYLKHLSQLPNHQDYLDLKLSVQEKFNQDIQQKLSKMVWSEGACKSYYLIDGNGKNTSLWPGSTMAFRRATKKINPDNYDIIHIEKIKNSAPTTPHLASSEVIIDNESKQIRLYYHGVVDGSLQKSKVALSDNGLHFKALSEIISLPYLRVFPHRGDYYGLAMPDFLYRSKNGLTNVLS